MQYGLIGEHLSHSFSVEIHQLIGEYDYQLVEIAPDELNLFLKKREFRGLNVTIPYKQKVIPMLDHISPEASRIGAVNTIVNREGELWGYNTDYYGFLQAAKHISLDFRGRNLLVLGRGGAAKAISLAANDSGAAGVTLTGRDTDVNALLNSCEFDCIVNATPVGMFPNIFDLPSVIPSSKNNLKQVMDCVYNPLRTKLVVDAQMNGIRAEGGLYMLVAQAVKAASLFLDKEFEESLTESFYEKILERKRNTVLIGMPSCGKSTLGRRLAQEQGREFLDTDEEIVRRERMTIPDIFNSKGEEYFRRVEKAVIKDLSSSQGCVIATGGGAILDSENMINLKMNGNLIYLYKNPEELSVGNGRPLSKDRDSINSMFELRNPLYLSFSDEILNT